MDTVQTPFTGFGAPQPPKPKPSQRPRYLWFFVIGAVAFALVVTGTLLVVSASPSNTASTSTPPTADATVTDTVAGTSTATAHPTATRKPTKAPANNPAKAPPPPPIPTPPAATPTVTFCPTATATRPAPTATATATTLPPTATSTATTTGAVPANTLAYMAPAAGACQSCPYYKGNNPSQSQIRTALYAAADQYHLPRNLLLAVAWQESRWHEDVTSCDGGIGLMQVQYYTWPWLNGVNVPQCGLAPTSYDPNTLQGNANLGAKFLVWISCYYSYWGNNGGTSVSNPGVYTMAWYYQQAHLPYPDSKNANSFCAAVFNDPNHSEYADLPSTTAQPWSCPYSATTGDVTLLDITLSAYNEGPGYTSQNGIQNWWYVQGVEAKIVGFATGALPA
jgi:hypothetical protein